MIFTIVSLIQKRFILIAVTLLTMKASAQQVSLYNHYFYNPTVYNPAFTGFREATNVTLITRNQWTGFKGSPKLNALLADGLISRKMGLGVQVFSDKKGFNKTLGGSLLYSYRVDLNKVSHLNFGASFGFLSRSIDFSEATVQDFSDPTFLTSNQNQTNFNGNLGLAYFWKDLEIGISINQISKQEFSYGEEFQNTLSFTPAQHYINSLKYRFTLSRQKQLYIAPQLLTRYVKGAPIQYELNTNIYFNKFWAGVTYGKESSVRVNAGISLLQKLDIGYSYGVISNGIGQYAGATQELMINFKLGRKKDPVKEFKKELIKEVNDARVSKQELIGNDTKEISTSGVKSDVKEDEAKSVVNEEKSVSTIEKEAEKGFEEELKEEMKDVKKNTLIDDGAKEISTSEVKSDVKEDEAKSVVSEEKSVSTIEKEAEKGFEEELKEEMKDVKENTLIDDGAKEISTFEVKSDVKEGEAKNVVKKENIRTLGRSAVKEFEEELMEEIREIEKDKKNGIDLGAKEIKTSKVKNDIKQEKNSSIIGRDAVKEFEEELMEEIREIEKDKKKRIDSGAKEIKTPKIENDTKQEK